MKFLIAAVTLLLMGTTMAAPGTAMRRERNQNRARTSRRGGLIDRIDGAAHMASDVSNVQYSSNWAGAVLVGTGFTSVTGTFKVPTPSSAGSGSAWVGIDGDTCGTAILQTGVDWTKSGSSVTYNAWYEWYPDYAYDFTGISLSAGDTITVTVTASSLTAGVATIENVTKGTSVKHSFSNEGSKGSLCEYNAEWIVEDFEQSNALVSFANFGSVAFTSCSATDNGTKVGVTGATMIDIRQNNVTLTNCSTSGSSGVICNYV